MIRRLSCAFSLIVDSAGQRKGTCQQQGAPQRKIAAVHSAGAGSALDEDDLDGMGSADILKGVGLYRADALAVDLDSGDGIALVRGDGEGLISALTDADAAGGGDRAASPGGCLDGVVAVAAAVTAVGLVMQQLDLAGQGRVVGVRGRKAPLVGSVDFDPGIVGQSIAIVNQPLQLADNGIQRAALGGQRRVP